MSTPAALRSIFRPGLFSGKAHWVTGGGSGICDTACFDVRDEEALKAGVAAVSARHGPVAETMTVPASRLDRRLPDFAANAGLMRELQAEVPAEVPAA